MKTLVLAVSLLFFVITSNAIVAEAQAVSAKTGEETLRQLEADFMKAAAEKGSKGFMSYYADAAVELPNGADMIRGKENIAKGMVFLDQKDNQLTWTPVQADMASSGDLGYTFGTFEFRSKGKDGKPLVEHGKYSTIWKKQPNGEWKVVMDMGNASPGPKP